MKNVFVIALVLLVGLPGMANADKGYPYPEMQIIETPHSFKGLIQNLRAAIKNNKMNLVSQACGSCAAKNQGFDIPGNYVAGVFRNDFARRLFAAHVEAGIEAPLRFYITEGSDGTATLTYRKPSAVFAAYKVSDLEPLGQELDQMFATIANEAVQ